MTVRGLRPGLQWAVGEVGPLGVIARRRGSDEVSESEMELPSTHSRWVLERIALVLMVWSWKVMIADLDLEFKALLYLM